MPRVIIVPAITIATNLNETRERFFAVESFDNPEVRLISRAPVQSVDEALRRFVREQGFDPSERVGYDRTMMEDDLDRAQKERTAALEAIDGPHRWGIAIHDYEFASVTVDPMVSELIWRLDMTAQYKARNYADTEGILMSHEKCQERFWHRRAEVEAWVEAHAREDVLVQPTETGIRFVCLTATDSGNLRDWLRQPKEHEVRLPLEGARYDNIMRWIESNVHGEWFAVKPQPKNRPGTLVLMIRDQRDAVMTKLRWSDPLDGMEPEDAETD